MPELELSNLPACLTGRRSLAAVTLAGLIGAGLGAAICPDADCAADAALVADLYTGHEQPGQFTGASAQPPQQITDPAPVTTSGTPADLTGAPIELRLPPTTIRRLPR